MELLTFFLVVCVLLGFYAYRVDRRRKRSSQEFSEQLAALTARIYELEEQLQGPFSPTLPQLEAAKRQPAFAPLAVPRQLTAAVAPELVPPPVTTPTPEQPELAPESHYEPAAVDPILQPESFPLPTPLPAVSATSAAGAEYVAGDAAPSLTADVFPEPMDSAAPAPAVARIEQPFVKPPKRSFEEVLGIRLFPIIGIAAVVVGIGFLLGTGWANFPAWLRVLILYTAGLGLLTGGIFLEGRVRYRLLGRGFIGGGWAVTAATSYAIANLPQELVLPSRTLDLFLLLAVVGAMVWHTVKYNSQVVTGVAFLLGFLAIGMNPVPPFNLIAGALLIAGMTVIVLRYRWYQLEVFGIFASYLNHFYWLYQAKSDLSGGFPHSAGLALVIGYWVVFRTSYLCRSVSTKNQESVSTLAGLLNPVLLLGVIKYQSFHPEWAFYALLTMGAVEFVLGQLPRSRQRRAPFFVLSSLGATLMVAALPFKYSGNSLEVLWLAAGEAFLLAGIFTRERLFRAFGLIVSFLVAGYGLEERVAPLVQQITEGGPHYDPSVALLLAVIALVLYANSHVAQLVWPDLFTKEFEQVSLKALSLGAGLFAVASAYSYFPNNVVAIVLAVLVVMLSWTGGQFSFPELTYQAHAVAVLTVVQVISVGTTMETVWQGIPSRVLAFAPVALLLYLSSRFVRLSESLQTTFFAAAYTWAATGLLTILIWLQAADWLVAVLWIGLALALILAAQTLKRVDFKWQAFALVLLAAARVLAVNLELTTTFRQLSMRLISVSIVALGIYLLARWAPLDGIRPVYTAVGTLLLGILSFKETPAPWTAVAWIALSLALALGARLWKDRALLWETHLLSALAAGWTLYANFDPQYRGSRVQWITVGITALALYALTWITNVAAIVGNERVCQAYAWTGSLLVSWLAWYQLQPITVSAAWGAFGLLLFEFPELARRVRINVRFAESWRAQAYVALAAAFVHIFYSNFNAPGWGPALYAVLPLAPIYFYIYWQLTGKPATAKIELRAEYMIACLGTATLASLVRFELPPETIAIGYAALVVAALLVAWLARRQIFLYQALVLLGFTAFRISMTNFYHLKEPYSSSLNNSIWTIAVLACTVPLAYRVRKTAKTAEDSGWVFVLTRHPEQPMFFVPVLLLAVMLFLKLSGGKVTGAWGLEGFAVFVLALWAKERSFRLTGLALLLLSIGKLVYDTFYFHDLQIKYLTWIGVGILILVVALLYARNRDALQDYL